MNIDFSKYKEDIKLIREVMDEEQMQAMFRMMQVLFMESFFGYVPNELSDIEEQKKKVAVPKEVKIKSDEAIDEDIEIDSARIEKVIDEVANDPDAKILGFGTFGKAKSQFDEFNKRFEMLLQEMTNDPIMDDVEKEVSEQEIHEMNILEFANLKATSHSMKETRRVMRQFNKCNEISEIVQKKNGWVVRATNGETQAIHVGQDMRPVQQWAKKNTSITHLKI